MEEYPIYHWTECGCKLFKKDIKRKDGQKVCREHLKPLFKRTRLCKWHEGCNTEVVLGCSGVGVQLCPKHMLIKLEERNKQKHIKQYARLIAIRKANGGKPIIKRPRVKSKIPKNLRGWSKGRRADYCSKLSSCDKASEFVCEKCNSFLGYRVFGYHDPGMVA